MSRNLDLETPGTEGWVVEALNPKQGSSETLTLNNEACGLASSLRSQNISSQDYYPT